MFIYSNFDSGNIIVNKIEGNRAFLNIRKDTNSDHSQWFHFRVNGKIGEKLAFTIENAGEQSYPKGFENYSVRFSFDREEWFALPTKFNGKTLQFQIEMEASSVYFAYFAPYSYEQHLDLIAFAQEHPLCTYESLGLTKQKRTIDLLTIGHEEEAEKKIWIIARQHPGESMAEWFIEGLLERLLDSDDAVSTELLNKAAFYIVPNMNPDGSVLGNLRTNSLGINLNREWDKSTPEKSPEVFYVYQKMKQTGLDLNLDIHGDEALPYNFISAAEGIPSYDKAKETLENAFIDKWIEINPDFQKQFGYEKDAAGEANLSMCTNQLSEYFGKIALTLEMPFKDNANLPDEMHAWSPERSKNLGASVLNVIWSLFDKF